METNKRAKNELTEIWVSGYAVVSAIIVFIPILFYTLYKLGLFNTNGMGTMDDVGHIAKLLLIVGGLAYAPVWITCAFYIVYLLMKSIITAGIVLNRASEYQATQNRAPKTISKEELIDKLKNE